MTTSPLSSISTPVPRVFDRTEPTGPSPPDRQLFIIGVEAWRAACIEEIDATVAVLKQVSAYGLPFDAVDIDVPADEYVNWVPKPGEKPKRGMAEALTHDGKRVFRSNLGNAVVARFIGVNLTGAPIKMFVVDHRTGYREEITTTDVQDRGQNMADLLITLLATRNATKTVKHSKLAKLGIGKNKMRYEYTTTIGVPMVEELGDDEEHPPTGRTVCPHLRRAHLRNVAYGPGRELRRPRLIQAVFVNADREWTKTRVGYNVSL